MNFQLTLVHFRHPPCRNLALKDEGIASDSSFLNEEILVLASISPLRLGGHTWICDGKARPRTVITMRRSTPHGFSVQKVLHRRLIVQVRGMIKGGEPGLLIWTCLAARKLFVGLIDFLCFVFCKFLKIIAQVRHLVRMIVGHLATICGTNLPLVERIVILRLVSEMAANRTRHKTDFWKVMGGSSTIRKLCL